MNIMVFLNFSASGKCQFLQFVSRSAVPLDGCCHAPSIYHARSTVIFPDRIDCSLSCAAFASGSQERNHPWPHSKRKYPFRCSGRSSTPRVSSTVFWQTVFAPNTALPLSTSRRVIRENIFYASGNVMEVLSERRLLRIFI